MDSDFWNSRYLESEAMWSQTPNEFVVEYLSQLPVGAMADFAGGEGRNALWFAGRGWMAENIDFSSVAVERSKQWAWEQGVANRFVGTVADATAPGTSTLAPLDLAVMAYLQLPAEQLREAIANAVAQLKPGGLFFGVWHARENLDGGFGGPPDPAVLPTQEELRAACSKAGATVRSLELRDRAVGEHSAIDVALVAKVAE